MPLKRRNGDGKIYTSPLFMILLTALITGGGSYFVFAQNKADKQEVRDSLDTAKDYTDGKLSLVEQRVDTVEKSVVKMETSMAEVKAITLIIATQLRADLPDSLKRLR